MARQQRPDTGPTLTALDHLRELKTRFFIVAGVFLTVSVVAYVFRDWLITLLTRPIGDQKLITLTPEGGFSFVFLVTIYAGLAVAIPFLIHQLYGFSKPVLPEKMRKYSAQIFFYSLLLMSAGIAFGYLMAIPGALDFLQTFATEYVDSSLTADSYLKFVVAFMLGLGIVFQLPIALMLIHWIKPLSPGGLLKSERWVVLLSFIAAAIITPTPDPLNQTMIALPIIAVYQIGVVAILLSIRKEKKMKQRLTLPTQVTKHAVKKPRTRPTQHTAPATPALAPKVQHISHALKPAMKHAMKPSPTQKQIMSVQSIDGVVQRRPRTGHVTPPTRPVQTAQLQRTYTASRPQPQGQFARSIYLDGVSPRMAVSS